jgi:hypothetical protein
MRRGRYESIRVRRALIILVSASGTPVSAIARLVAAHENAVRDVIQRKRIVETWQDRHHRRLADLGAQLVVVLNTGGLDHYAVAMTDPEGNEFDIN